MTFPFPVMFPVLAGGTTSIWTDFSEYTPGVFMPDWASYPSLGGPPTSIVAVAPGGSISGQALKVTGTGSLSVGESCAFTWSDVPLVADCEILLGVFVTQVVPAYRLIGGPIARFDLGTVRYVYAEAYGTTQDIYAIRAADGGSPVFASVNDAVWGTNLWYWMRHRSIGGTHEFKMWLRGTTEPAGWTVSLSSAIPAAAGATGFHAATGNLSEQYWDFFSVSIDGTPAWGPV